MNELIREIGKSKGYDDKLCNTLEKIIPAMIMHYGEEYRDLIFKVLEETTITMCKPSENVYDTLNKLETIEEDESIVGIQDVKIAAGVSSTIPRISCKDGEFSIDKLERHIVLAFGDIESKAQIRTLVHEFSHALKSYENSHYIKDDIYYSRSGFIEIFERLSLDENGKVVRTLISEKNVGMEEGFNSLDDSIITSIITGEDRKFESYRGPAVIAEEADCLLGYRNERIKAQLTGDIDTYKNIYNGSSSEDLFGEQSKNLDEVVKEEYKLFRNILLYGSDKEEDKKLLEEIQNRRAELVHVCRNNIDKAIESKVNVK